jgi:hypothetical protein
MPLARPITSKLPKTAGRSATVPIFDVAGRVASTLPDAAVVPAGRREVVWRGLDNRGRRVSVGVYFCRMEGDGFVRSQPMTWVKSIRNLELPGIRCAPRPRLSLPIHAKTASRPTMVVPHAAALAFLGAAAPPGAAARLPSCHRGPPRCVAGATCSLGPRYGITPCTCCSVTSATMRSRRAPARFVSASSRPTCASSTSRNVVTPRP